jgi:hypothetical protein
MPQVKNTYSAQAAELVSMNLAADLWKTASLSNHLVLVRLAREVLIYRLPSLPQIQKRFGTQHFCPS